MLKLSKALCALLALCLLASTSLAEEEGLVAFQEEINGVRFHAMVDASIAEAPVIEGAFWDPASGHEALAQNLGAYFGVPAALEREDAQYGNYGYALGDGLSLVVQGSANQTLYVKDSPYTDWLFASNRGHFGEEDFQFASREEAARRVDELIRAMGLGLQMQCSGAYSVNGAQYIARVEEETGNYATLGKDFAGRALPGVEADDEIAYVLTFEQVVNGLPLSARCSIWNGRVHWSSLCTEAVLSPAGVERLTLFSPYMPKSSGEPQALISYRAAALSLANSEDVRSSLELYGEGEFSRVRLCYMAEVRENDAAHVRLLPVWEFQGVFVRENDPSQITCLVSALSGEVIGLPG